LITHDLPHDLSERTVYIPLLLFVVMTNKEQSHHRITGALVAESLTKDLLLAVIQQRLLGVNETINSNKDLYSVSQNTEVEILIGDMNVGTAYLNKKEDFKSRYYVEKSIHQVDGKNVPCHLTFKKIQTGESHPRSYLEAEVGTIICQVLELKFLPRN
jgi:hypothetical protein